MHFIPFAILGCHILASIYAGKPDRRPWLKTERNKLKSLLEQLNTGAALDLREISFLEEMTHPDLPDVDPYGKWLMRLVEDVNFMKELL